MSSFNDYLLVSLVDRNICMKLIYKNLKEMDVPIYLLSLLSNIEIPLDFGYNN